MAKTKKQNKIIKKSVAVSVRQDEFVLTGILSNQYFYIAILFVFWLIFFRELLSGSAYLFDDFLEQYYPGKFMSSVMISKGIFPFWNPYIFSGMPFFADLQIAVLYPFNFALSLFVQGDKLSPLVIQNSIIIHYFIGSIFSFYLCRYFKVSNFLSFIFSLLFTYSSYMMIHMIHMPLIEAVIWFPLFFLLWLKFTDTKNYLYAITGGLIMGLCILAGYPQVPFLNFLFVGIYTLYLMWNKYKEKNKPAIMHLFLGLTIAVIITAGITAFQLLPTLEFISLSNRANFDYDFAKQGSFHFFDLITFFIPKFFGVWSGNEHLSELQYWSKHQEGPWMFTVANIFISSFLLITLIPSLRILIKEKIYKTLIYFLLFIIIFSILFALGGNFFFHKLLYDYVPFFNRFRNPAHILYLTIFSLLLINVLGLNEILKNNKLGDYFNKKYFLYVGIFVVFVFIIISSGMLTSGDLKQESVISSYTKGQFFIFLLFTSGYGIIIYLLTQGKLKFNTGAIVIIALLTVELYTIWYGINNGTKNPETLYFQRAPQLTSMFKEDMKDEIFRVNMRDGGQMLLQRNQGFIDNVEYIEGYGALILKNYIPPNKNDKQSTQTHDLMNVKYKMMTDSSGKKGLGLSTTYLPRAMMFYDIKKISNEDDVKQYMSSNEYDYRKTLVIEEKQDIPVLNNGNDTLVPINKITYISRDINSMKIDIETSKDGYLFLSEVYYPAFKTKIDGNITNIYKSDFCYRSVYIPAGKHILDMYYDSNTFNSGLVFSFGTLGIVIVLLPIIMVYNSKKKIKDATLS